jgi:hypothetical protein
LSSSSHVKKIARASGNAEVQFSSSANGFIGVVIDMPYSALARAYKRGNKLVPEVALCAGPAAGEGITNSGSVQDLYGGMWVLSLEKSGVLKLGRYNGANWIQVTPLSALPVLPRAARHISMSFDQAARPVIAWEENQQIFVRQYDGSSGLYEIRGPFAGVDPVLWCDAIALGIIPDSDVILFGLTTNRLAVTSRIQRELYSAERNVYVLPSAGILEIVVSEPKRFKLVVSTLSNLLILSSQPYPIQNSDVLQTQTMISVSLEFTTLARLSSDVLSAITTINADVVSSVLARLPSDILNATTIINADLVSSVLARLPSDILSTTTIINADLVSNLVGSNLSEQLIGTSNLTGALT